MNWYIGTMGFSYSDWIDVCYPSGISSQKYLAFYSRIFNSVEIDSTFYGTPRIETVQRWKQLTPPSFKICVKLPKVVTHELVLINVAGLMYEFLERISLLQEKLGVILIQFPPSFSAEQMSRLEEFLPTLPADFRFAIEIRNKSWFTKYEEFVTLLRKYNVCWVATEYPGLPRTISVSTDFIYIRWIGQHGSFSRHNRVRISRTDNMRMWWQEIKNIAKEELDIYGYFNNDYAGFAPGSANEFKEIIGLPIEQFRPPQQGRLF